MIALSRCTALLVAAAALIPALAAAHVVFTARNPASGAEIAWKAHQHFADGTVSDWTGPPSKRPASITKLVTK
ncbi:MAG TPA: hypothetical protein VNJ02_15830 [Vicinamibacterales bacterium]|nr:hypothetical protein [Vicinamibacterales bacterium]